MLDIYQRLLSAGLLSIFAYSGLGLELVAPLLTLLLRSVGISKERITRFTVVAVNPLMELTSAAVFVLSFLWLKSPFSEAEQVLLSLGVSYLATAMVIGVHFQVRGSEPGRSWTRMTLEAVLGLVVTIHIWALLRLIGIGLAFYNAFQSLVDFESVNKKLQAAAASISKLIQKAQSQPPEKVLRLRWASGAIPLVLLAFAYWLLRIPGLSSFLEFAFYLLIAYVLMQWAFVGMRRPEPAQLRWINPFGIAATFVILFTFYVALLLGQGENPGAYLANVTLFLTFLWYVSFLSRREVTIEEGRDATGSPDRDFQMDSAEVTMGWFFGSLVRLQPLVLAAVLTGTFPETVERFGGAMGTSWFVALLIAGILMLLSALAFLLIWARNIGNKELVHVTDDGTEEKLAGTDGRDPYPEYRQQLATSALPCCVFIPAMVFGLLSLLGFRLALGGFSGIWLDLLFYGLVAVTLFGLFVQFPFRTGQIASQGSEERERKRLEESLERQIWSLHSSQTRKAADALSILAGELTLARLKERRKRQKEDLNYRLRLFGEGISSGDAVSFVRGLIATALAAGAGVLMNVLLGVPES